MLVLPDCVVCGYLADAVGGLAVRRLERRKVVEDARETGGDGVLAVEMGEDIEPVLTDRTQHQRCHLVGIESRFGRGEKARIARGVLGIVGEREGAAKALGTIAAVVHHPRAHPARAEHADADVAASELVREHLAQADDPRF